MFHAMFPQLFHYWFFNLNKYILVFFAAIGCIVAGVHGLCFSIFMLKKNSLKGMSKFLLLLTRGLKVQFLFSVQWASWLTGMNLLRWFHQVGHHLRKILYWVSLFCFKEQKTCIIHCCYSYLKAPNGLDTSIRAFH